MKLVYQSGHGDIYCDRQKHLRLVGDMFGDAPASSATEGFAKVSVYKCDCSQWLNKKADAELQGMFNEQD